MRATITSHVSSASGILAVRKHPLSVIEPSNEDTRYSFELMEAALCVDMRFLVYILLKNSNYNSYSSLFRDEFAARS